MLPLKKTVIVASNGLGPQFPPTKYCNVNICCQQKTEPPPFETFYQKTPAVILSGAIKNRIMRFKYLEYYKENLNSQCNEGAQNT